MLPFSQTQSPAHPSGQGESLEVESWLGWGPGSGEEEASCLTELCLDDQTHVSAPVFPPLGSTEAGAPEELREKQKWRWPEPLNSPGS